MLVDTRRRGFSVEDGEVTAGFSSVGAPIVDPTGHPVASLALTYPADTSDTEALARAVSRTAHMLSRRLGGRT